MTASALIANYSANTDVVFNAESGLVEVPADRSSHLLLATGRPGDTFYRSGAARLLNASLSGITAEHIAAAREAASTGHMALRNWLDANLNLAAFA